MPSSQRHLPWSSSQVPLLQGAAQGCGWKKTRRLYAELVESRAVTWTLIRREAGAVAATAKLTGSNRPSSTSTGWARGLRASATREYLRLVTFALYRKVPGSKAGTSGGEGEPCTTSVRDRNAESAAVPAATYGRSTMRTMAEVRWAKLPEGAANALISLTTPSIAGSSAERTVTRTCSWNALAPCSRRPARMAQPSKARPCRATLTATRGSSRPMASAAISRSSPVSAVWAPSRSNVPTTATPGTTAAGARARAAPAMELASHQACTGWPFSSSRTTACHPPTVRRASTAATPRAPQA
mmetsp:Transcript_35667/g.101908  ORF Transcript_35667/g.101908 Transcript_35667/m.101908 type:complete len:299 (+) Transcript_35667:186-1082(+)